MHPRGDCPKLLSIRGPILGSYYNTGPYIHFPHSGNSNLGKLPRIATLRKHLAACSSSPKVVFCTELVCISDRQAPADSADSANPDPFGTQSFVNCSGQAEICAAEGTVCSARHQVRHGREDTAQLEKVG